MNFDDTTGILTVDEFELHDALAGLRDRFIQNDAIDSSTCIDYIEIVPKEPDKFTGKLVKLWEGRMEKLLMQMGQLDAWYHDDAEYTC
jgi:hypothetical protein